MNVGMKLFPKQVEKEEESKREAAPGTEQLADAEPL